MSVDRQDGNRVCVTRRGNLQVRTSPGGQERVRFTACPFSGDPIGPTEEPWRHFLEGHGPTDAGLSPLSAERDGQSELGSFGGDAQ